MRTIGLIGGMSRESAATHYRVLDELARERLGGPHSAKLPTYSFDFAEIEALRAGGDWGGAGEAITTKLCRGVVDDASRRAWVEIVRGEVEGGADGVILGRTPRGACCSRRRTCRCRRSTRRCCTRARRSTSRSVELAPGGDATRSRAP